MTYKIRLGGTNEFVSEIDGDCNCCFPKGHVKFVEGWNNLSAIVFPTLNLAERAAEKIGKIEGFHTTVEKIKRKMS
jgi:hypothetical protein